MVYRGISKTVYVIEDQKFAGGGEGSLHRIQDNDKQVAKIFKEGKRSREREEKLCLMVQTKLSEEHLKQVTWPQDVIYDQNGFAGYIMPRIEHASSLTEIYTSNAYDLRFRLMTAVNLCSAVDTVHEMGQVCGDLNPQNICVNLNTADRQNAFKVTLVDTDSYHFTSGDKTYRCEVGLGDYIAPELQKKLANGGDLRTVSLPSYTRETDLFALAVHIFYLLMNGCHPFACAKDSNRQDSNIAQLTGRRTQDSVVAPQPVENIKDGFFPFFQKKEGVTIPVYAPGFDSLPQQIRGLFVRTFVVGYNDPKKRPGAMEWRRALIPLLKSMVRCTADPRHFYFSNAAECPLCRINKEIANLMRPAPAPAAASANPVPAPSSPVPVPSSPAPEYDRKLPAIVLGILIAAAGLFAWKGMIHVDDENVIYDLLYNLSYLTMFGFAIIADILLLTKHVKPSWMFFLLSGWANLGFTVAFEVDFYQYMTPLFSSASEMDYLMSYIYTGVLSSVTFWLFIWIGVLLYKFDTGNLRGRMWFLSGLAGIWTMFLSALVGAFVNLGTSDMVLFARYIVYGLFPASLDIETWIIHLMPYSVIASYFLIGYWMYHPYKNHPSMHG